MLLEGKVAIVTGASRGIGKAIAQQFIAQGAKVAFTYRSSAEAAKALEDELSAGGGTVQGFQSDAASMTDAERLVKEVVEAFGTVDIVINNAGITDDTLLMRMTEEQWDRVISVNLKSCFENRTPVLGSATSVNEIHNIHQAKDRSVLVANWERQKLIVVHHF